MFDSWIVVALIGAFLGLQYAAHRCRVALIDLQFTHHHEAWIVDGRPQGGSVTRQELSFLGSYFARHVVGLRWLASTPAWLAKTRGAVDLIRRYRVLWWLSLLTFAALVVFMVGGE